MTARDTYKRIRAYARANKRTVYVFTETGVLVRIHEHHAWKRLPKHVQKVIQEPKP